MSVLASLTTSVDNLTAAVTAVVADLPPVAPSTPDSDVLAQAARIDAQTAALNTALASAPPVATSA